MTPAAIRPALPADAPAIAQLRVDSWRATNRGMIPDAYDRLGAELLFEQPFEWDGMDLVEAGYGWHDLDALAAACSPPAITQH